MEKIRMVFSGSGGQGVITAAVVLAEAAVLHEDLVAIQTQAYGAAARGGAARSNVIIADSEIYFPMVIKPNVLVCLTQTAYIKFSPIIRPGGLLLTDTRYVETHKNIDARQFELPMYTTVMDKIGKPIVFNVCMLGAIIALTNVVKPESVFKVLKTRIPENFIEMNNDALNIGIELGKEAIN